MLLFQAKQNLGVISVQNLAGALNGKKKTIQLPSFQRDAIWSEEHVEKLWDSILRGFPIGSLLLARAEDVDITQVGVRPLQVSPSEAAHRTSTEADNTEFIIIDGQQRSITIALGLRQWRPRDSARLWIDLGQPAKPDIEPYRFFACTFLKPWGREATTAMQREALGMVDAVALKNDNTLKLDDETLRYTWPVRAELPVPFADVLNLLDGPRKDEWRTLVPKAKQSGTPREDLEDLFEKVKQTVTYEIPIFLAKNLTIEELGQVFHRLNKQGYDMSDEELFFSALKMAWPKAHDLVWDIYSDAQTGRFLQPTKIVHVAVRLVAALDKSDVVRLDRSEFRKLLEGGEKGQSYLSGLKALLKKADADRAEVGELNHSLRLARQALQYHPADSEQDPGLPITLLARLRWRVWHTLVAWINTHKSVDPVSRLEMLRYAMLDHFCTKSTSTSLMKEPFKLALEADGQFPGFEIYQALRERELLKPNLLTPEQYHTQLCDNEKPTEHILQRERDLVLWVQRCYFHLWFPQFDPTLYKTEADLPYDLDHIIPQAHLDMRGRRYELPADFWSHRNAILHGPGNIRYWPKALNRADGNKNLADKYLLGEPDQETPLGSYLRDFELTTIAEVRRASFILDDQLSEWEQACNNGNDPYNWSNPERLRAFRQATELRRKAMYTTFYEQIGWGSWLDRIQPPSQEQPGMS
jgi:hypothetical protein